MPDSQAATAQMIASSSATASAGANGHPAAQSDLKRKRSASHETQAAAPPPKNAKTHNHLQINYLARQIERDLPLVNSNATLPSILELLNDYQGVLDRHESMACNLGARPLGPILMRRFEKIFDGPPRVLTCNNKDGATVTWLDVVEFARNKPEQFNLEMQHEGQKVCQFYTKQCRVQISEEDYLLISSGIPQQMIPPQPIVEDEEKELSTLEMVEKNLTHIIQLADQVAARGRQLNHRIKGRRQAILDRRATASPAPPVRPASPSNVALMNGAPIPHAVQSMPPMAQPTQSSQGSGGFVAVNSRPLHDLNVPSRPLHDANANGASQATRNELLSKFQTADRRASSQPTTVQPKAVFSDGRRPSIGQQAPLHAPPSITASAKTSPKPADHGSSTGSRGPGPFSDSELPHMNSPVPIPGTPSNLLATATQRASQPQEKDDGGIFKAEMVRRVEILGKNERILPPCDRCRRLHMDCLKNLTACLGCTKKHAKCSWREVREEELRPAFPQHVERNGMHSEGEEAEHHERTSTSSSPRQGVMPISHTGTGAPHPFQLDDRVATHSREPPPAIDRERERGVEAAHLQETARSGLAHVSHGRLGAAEGKAADYQTLVA